MKYQHILLLIAFFMSSVSSVNAEISPYINKQEQTIKALSEERIQQYLNGEGMGFALSAELNQYPGPKHVIELSDQLSLTDTQLVDSNALFSQMNLEAKALGVDLIAEEKKLESLFRTGTITPQQIRKSVTLISGIQSELRSLHLVTHIQQKKILSMHQQQLYQQLRGYNNEESKHLHHKNHKH